MRENSVRLLLFFTFIAWIVVGGAAVLGLWRTEPPLQNPRKKDLIATAMDDGAIKITQKGEGPLAPAFNQNRFSENIPEKEWRELENTIRKMVAASNRGLGSPFRYKQQADTNERDVSSFNTAEFDYFNPFENEEKDYLPTAITYASDAAQRTEGGWRVIGPKISLIIKPDAFTRELQVAPGGDTTIGGVPPIAQTFILQSGKNRTLKLSLVPPSRDDPDKPRSKTLGVNVLDNTKREIITKRPPDGGSFIWEGTTYVVQKLANLPDPKSGPEALPEKNDASAKRADLVVSKRVNGRLMRLNLFGESTMNLIGGQTVGRTRLLDDAIKSAEASEVRLTLDPDLQYESFRLMKTAIEEINNGNPLQTGRRRGSVAILNSETGGILALAGYPSVDPSLLEQRRVLVDRDALMQNPAFEKHMAGSTVKVLTVALGYLLDGSGDSKLLPPSDNIRAVRQTFRDAYGRQLTAPLGEKAKLTPEAEKEFEQFGGPSKLRSDCSNVLQQVFGVLPQTNSQVEAKDVVREDLVSDKFKGYFSTSVKGICPVKSTFPVENADSMSRLRNYALGGEEARFTTMRLAAILGTAVHGKRYDPYLIEAIRDRSGNLIGLDRSGVNDISVSTSTGDSNIPKMTSEMRVALGEVLTSGTGYFWMTSGKQHYLSADDPLTKLDESNSRTGDFGKSGTATYDLAADKPDSVFVYAHGNYLIAVWLEHADFDDKSPEAQTWRNNTAHKTVHRIVQFIENLEGRSGS